MKFKEKLSELVADRKTVICVGLDSDFDKMPEHIKKLDNPILEFNKQIIEATSDIVCSYKPNIAFYETVFLNISVIKNVFSIFFLGWYPIVMVYRGTAMIRFAAFWDGY